VVCRVKISCYNLVVRVAQSPSCSSVTIVTELQAGYPVIGVRLRCMKVFSSPDSSGSAYQTTEMHGDRTYTKESSATEKQALSWNRQGKC
jgi:hypothetical protein